MEAILLQASVRTTWIAVMVATWAGVARAETSDLTLRKDPGQVDQEVATGLSDLTSVPGGFYRDRQGRVMQVSFDLGRRVWLGVGYAPRRRLTGEVEIALAAFDFGASYERLSGDGLTRYRLHLIDGDVRVYSFGLDMTAVRFDLSHRYTGPLVRITTFFGEPERHDFYLNVAAPHDGQLPQWTVRLRLYLRVSSLLGQRDPRVRDQPDDGGALRELHDHLFAADGRLLDGDGRAGVHVRMREPDAEPVRPELRQPPDRRRQLRELWPQLRDVAEREDRGRGGVRGRGVRDSAERVLRRVRSLRRQRRPRVRVQPDDGGALRELHDQLCAADGRLLDDDGHAGVHDLAGRADAGQCPTPRIGGHADVRSEGKPDHCSRRGRSR